MHGGGSVNCLCTSEIKHVIVSVSGNLYIVKQGCFVVLINARFHCNWFSHRCLGHDGFNKQLQNMLFFKQNNQCLRVFIKIDFIQKNRLYLKDDSFCCQMVRPLLAIRRNVAIHLLYTVSGLKTKHSINPTSYQQSNICICFHWPGLTRWPLRGFLLIPVIKHIYLPSILSLWKFKNDASIHNTHVHISTVERQQMIGTHHGVATRPRVPRGRVMSAAN